MATATLHPPTPTPFWGYKKQEEASARAGYMTIKEFDRKFKVELDNLCRHYGILK